MKQAELEAEAKRQAQAQSMEAARSLKDFKRETDREAKRLRGQLAHTGCQVCRAHVEAARAAERAAREATKVKALKTHLVAQQEEFSEQLQQVRNLKGAMARRARHADRRATAANDLQVQLNAARAKVRETRLELSSMRAQLCLDDLHQGSASGEDEMTDTSSDDESCAANEALERVRTMHQWPAIRGTGAGKGAPKLEWGTRLVIYALLAMMVRPSAIGAAIVLIVKRTAPWLNPAAPAFEIVYRDAALNGAFLLRKPSQGVE